MPPAWILRDVAWSFSEPVPATATELVAAAKTYVQDIGAELDKTELERVFPGGRLDVEYAYWVREESSGPWSERRKVVRIEAGRKALTHAAILRDLHAAAFADLVAQDHHYFEGLSLLENPFEASVPAYETHLGS